jgi:hypothetical protein
MPDVLGLALRLNPPAGHQYPHDLLLGASRPEPGLRHLPLPGWDALGTFYSTVLPHLPAGASFPAQRRPGPWRAIDYPRAVRLRRKAGQSSMCASPRRFSASLPSRMAWVFAVGGRPVHRQGVETSWQGHPVYPRPDPVRPQPSPPARASTDLHPVFRQ